MKLAQRWSVWQSRLDCLSFIFSPLPLSQIAFGLQQSCKKAAWYSDVKSDEMLVESDAPGFPQTCTFWPTLKLIRAQLAPLLQIIPGWSWINSHFCPSAGLHLSEENMKRISSAPVEKYNAFQCWMWSYLGSKTSLLFGIFYERIGHIEKLLRPDGQLVQHCPTVTTVLLLLLSLF